MRGAKIHFTGIVTSAQPRFRLGRSFDQRHHEYLGYAVAVRGRFDGVEREARIAIGRVAHAKHAFCVGQTVEGMAESVANPEHETVELHRASGLSVVRGAPPATPGLVPPPWHGSPPSIETYRARGHRRLDARKYEASCASCIWGARMAVEMIIDHWSPAQKKHRIETFCYGPKSCALYRAGAKRVVPGRQGMSWTEENWIDEEETAHRGEDE